MYASVQEKGFTYSIDRRRNEASQNVFPELILSEAPFKSAYPRRNAMQVWVHFRALSEIHDKTTTIFRKGIVVLSPWGENYYRPFSYNSDAAMIGAITD